jgi:hypothetical protein
MSHGSVAFFMRGARSKGLLVGISIALVVESVAVHALVYRRWPFVSLALALLNVASIWWLAAEYRAVGEVATTVADDAIRVRYGRRIRADIPLDALREVRIATWKDVPTTSVRGYLKLSGGDDPNVLLMLDPPVRVALLPGIAREVRQLVLRMDQPDRFVEAVHLVRGPAAHPS